MYVFAAICHVWVASNYNHKTSTGCVNPVTCGGQPLIYCTYLRGKWSVTQFNGFKDREDVTFLEEYKTFDIIEIKL